MLNIYESQYAYMYDNEHAAYALCSCEVPVTLHSVSIQAERNAVDESCVYLVYLRIIAVQMKSRNPL